MYSVKHTLRKWIVAVNSVTHTHMQFNDFCFNNFAGLCSSLTHRIMKCNAEPTQNPFPTPSMGKWTIWLGLRMKFKFFSFVIFILDAVLLTNLETSFKWESFIQKNRYSLKYPSCENITNKQKSIQLEHLIGSVSIALKICQIEKMCYKNKQTSEVAHVFQHRAIIFRSCNCNVVSMEYWH